MMTRKNPSRADIPASPTEISKWQKASVDLVELKFRVHNILRQFSEEEKQSAQYKELTDILRGIIVHVIDDQEASHAHDIPIQIVNNITPEPKHTRSEKFTRMAGKFWNLQTLIVGLVTAIVTAIAPYAADIIRAIMGVHGGP